MHGGLIRETGQTLLFEQKAPDRHVSQGLPDASSRTSVGMVFTAVVRAGEAGSPARPK